MIIVFRVIPIVIATTNMFANNSAAIIPTVTVIVTPLDRMLLHIVIVVGY